MPILANPFTFKMEVMNMSENKKSNMTDRGFLILTSFVATVVLWLKFKINFVAIYFLYRYPIALAITVAVLVIYTKIKNKFVSLFEDSDLENEVLSASETDNSFFTGLTENGKRVYIKESSRRSHIQVVGSTNAGK